MRERFNAVVVSAVGAGLLASCVVTHAPRERPAAGIEQALTLDYNAFDQTSGGGWRAVVEAHRYREAAMLIDAYCAKKPGLLDWQIRNLRFHAGQLYAFVEDTETAIERFHGSLNPDEPETSPIRWNAYVRATIAFLEGDRDQLEVMRDVIAAGPEFQGRIPNLDVVDRLIRNIDLPYAEAYRTP